MKLSVRDIFFDLADRSSPFRIFTHWSALITSLLISFEIYSLYVDLTINSAYGFSNLGETPTIIEKNDGILPLFRISFDF